MASSISASETITVPNLKDAVIDSCAGGNENYTAPTIPKFEHVPRGEATVTIEMSNTLHNRSGLGGAPQAASHSTPATERTKAEKRMETIQFISLCGSLFMAGWNDGSTGPLLPRIQEVYHIGFAIVSLIFVIACVGFVSGAVFNVVFTDKLGFGKILAFGALLQVVAYIMQSTAPPFPLFVISYAINGVGIAVQDAQANGYVASLKDHPEAKMGIVHAIYGAGALCAPIVATQFAELERWSFYYLVSLGFACLNFVSLIAVFKFKSQDECLALIGQTAGEAGASEHSKIRQIFTQKAMYMVSAFILVYVGVEVTIGGWIVTFAKDVRGGGTSSGYISAGFFGGLMVGRVALLWVNQKVGERRVLFMYTILAIGLELVIWLVPSLIGNAVAVSVVGVLLGPFYPIAMNHTSKILPRWLLTGSIGWIAGFGQAGSALFPFITGAMAQKTGIKSLQPLLVAMMAFMLVLWAMIPNHARRAE